MSQWLEALHDVASEIGEPSAVDSDAETRAKAVEGCVARAVTGELDPTGELALGRYPPYLLPGSGVWLSKKGKYDSDDTNARDGLKRAVVRTLAVGWLMGYLSDGATYQPDRDERDVYVIWAPAFSDALRDVTGPEVAKQVQSAGSGVFVAGLKEAKLARFLGGSKVTQIGYLITGAGFLLELTQTDGIVHADEFPDVADRWKTLTAEDSLGRGRWAWDAVPPEPLG